MNDAGADAWVAERVTATGPFEVVSAEPWATVIRVPTASGPVWFKACSSRWRFEARLTAGLSARWPDRVVEVVAHEDERGWLLLSDAGIPVGDLGNAAELWLDALAAYAELQRGESERAAEHLAHGVPDLRVGRIPSAFDQMLRSRLPLDADGVARLHEFAPRLERLCEELASGGIADSVQHDDLHHRNLYYREGQYRVVDWGDASISHPFASLVVTFRFLEEHNGLVPGDRWFARLRDAYLEPWGTGLAEVFDIAMRVGTIAHAIGAFRQRLAIPAYARATYDDDYRIVLRRAVAATGAK